MTTPFEILSLIQDLTEKQFDRLRQFILKLVSPQGCPVV